MFLRNILTAVIAIVSAMAVSGETFRITSSTPVNGTSLDALSSGDVISIKTNLSSDYPEMYIMYEVRDLNDLSIIKSSTWLNRQSNGSYSASVYGNYKLLDGHTYSIYFTAWATEMDKNYRQPSLGNDSILIYGTAPAFRFSSVKLVSFTPELSDNEMLISTDTTFTAVFDGRVTVDRANTFINLGRGSHANFKSITPVAPVEIDGVTYSDEWIFRTTSDFLRNLKGELTLSIKVYDTKGLLVCGNMGIEEGSYFCFIYRTESQYADFSITIPGGQEESVSTFVLQSDEGIEYSYLYVPAKAIVMDCYGNEVAHVTTINGEGMTVRKNKKLTLILDRAVSAPGRYLLYLPHGMFTIGSELTAYGSMERLYSFSVGGVTPVTFTPAEGKTASLSDIVVSFPGQSVVAAGAGTAVMTIDNGAPIMLPPLSTDYDGDQSEIVQPLGTLYDNSGTYLVRFPAGYFLLGVDRKESEEIIVVYTIRTDFCGVEDVAVGGHVQPAGIYTLGGVKIAPASDTDSFGKLSPGVYIVDGKKVVIGRK